MNMIEVAKQLSCSIEGCNEKHYAKGLCRKCWSKQYRINNKEQIVIWRRGYYLENKEYIINFNKQYKEIHKEEIIDYGKQWREEHKEHLSKYQKQWWQSLSGKSKSKIYNCNRRALTKDLTKETVQRVYEDNIKQFGTLTCVLCGKPVEFRDSSLEHLTPLSRDGSNDYENLGVAHFKCNMKKQAMTLDEWFEKQEECKNLK